MDMPRKYSLTMAILLVSFITASGIKPLTDLSNFFVNFLWVFIYCMYFCVCRHAHENTSRNMGFGIPQM